MSENQGSKDQFSSLLGFLLVAIGAAVGVGSMWRFPYLCGANGGAAFIVAYLGVILLVGIPLLTAELSIGFASKQPPIKAYQTLHEGGKWHWAAFIHLAAAGSIISYTTCIVAWILNYFYQTAAGQLVGLDATALTANFQALTSNPLRVTIFGLIHLALCVIVVRGGLQKGAERVCKILMPVLAAILLIIIYNGLKLPNSSAGLDFLLKPDFSKFTFASLLAALGQAFFAIGMGILGGMVFGSYIKNPKEDLCKSSSCICISIIFAGLAAGFAIFPLVFAFGLEPTSGPGLAFLSLPNVFNHMAGGRALGTLFYLGFYIAAFTSTLGILEAITCMVKDLFHISRDKALMIIMPINVIYSVVTIYSERLFNFCDVLTSNYLIVGGVFVMSIFVGWVWGIDNFLAAINVRGAFARLWMRICVKYVGPVAIMVIFVGSFLQ